MATESPDWLEECYVEKILKNSEKYESIHVSSITVKPATAKGDNYASDIYRVGVDLSRVQDGREIQEKKSLILKIAPQGDMREELIEQAGFFETELSLMSTTLPKMTKLLKDVWPGCELCARCFYVQYKKPTHIFIDDLTPKGFQMAERQAGLDMDHCLLAMQNLGRFHGASIALREKDPEVFKNHTRGMLHMDQPSSLGELFNLALKQFAEETAKWPEIDPRITEKLRKLSGILFEKGCESAIYRENDFNVLNHGDFWVNNMLFRYDEHRKPIDFIFLDFQLSHYGSPAVDILYFIGTSTTNEIRLTHRELLLREYHGSLAETMVKLKCKTGVPTFEDLQEILRTRAFCEVFAALAILPAVALKKGEEIDFQKVVDLKEEYSNPSHCGKYRDIMTDLLPRFDSMGLLDV